MNPHTSYYAGRRRVNCGSWARAIRSEKADDRKTSRAHAIEDRIAAEGGGRL